MRLEVAAAVAAAAAAAGATGVALDRIRWRANPGGNCDNVSCLFVTVRVANCKSSGRQPGVLRSSSSRIHTASGAAQNRTLRRTACCAIFRSMAQP